MNIGEEQTRAIRQATQRANAADVETLQDIILAYPALTLLGV